MLPKSYDTSQTKFKFNEFKNNTHFQDNENYIYIFSRINKLTSMPTDYELHINIPISDNIKFSTNCTKIGTSRNLYLEKVVETFDYFDVSDDKYEKDIKMLRKLVKYCRYEKDIREFQKFDNFNLKEAIISCYVYIKEYVTLTDEYMNNKVYNFEEFVNNKSAIFGSCHGQTSYEYINFGTKVYY